MAWRFTREPNSLLDFHSGLAPELRRRWDSLPRTKSKFVKFCGGPAGGRLNLDEAEDAWQLLRAAVTQREAEEGMEESDSVLRRVQREAGFPEACPVHRLDYATSGCLAVALTQEGASDTVWKSKFYGAFAESSRLPPRHRRDASSTAWQCVSLTTRFSQHGRVVAEQ